MLRWARRAMQSTLGRGTHEAVASAFAALDAHAQAHPQALAPGRPQPVRQARDIMHRGAECIGGGDSLAAAAQKMRDLGVGSLPICGADDRLHGILTDRDIVLRCIAEGRDPAEVRASDLAQDTLFWVDAGAGVGEVLHQMGRPPCQAPAGDRKTIAWPASSPRPTWPATSTSTGSPSSSRRSTRPPDPRPLIRGHRGRRCGRDAVEDLRSAVTAGPRRPVGYLR